MQKLSLNGGCEELSDAELARLYAEGSNAAFAVLYDRYIRLIRSITSKYRVSGLEFDDLTQEGLLGLMSAAKTFRDDGGASFKNYAAVCISNRLRSLVKKHDTDKRKAPGGCVSIDENPNSTACEEANPEDMVIVQERLNALNKMISEQFTDLEYKVFRLYLAGCSYDAIAQRLAIDRRSVDNAMQRVRRKLRKYISSISL